MYFIRKIRKTKRRLNKSSFIVSLPKRLSRKIESQNKEISIRLENFARFHYFYDDIKGSGCFLLTLWNDELPPSPADKSKTTTIQKSGRFSRYVLIPKRICSKYGWNANIEIVIGLDYHLDKFVHESVYGNNGIFVNDNSQQQSHVCVIKFQRYQDMKKIYRQMLAKKKSDIAKEESDAYWVSRTNYDLYDILMNRINFTRKQLHKIVWDNLMKLNLVAISYNDFVTLRAQKEREKKKKRRELAKKYDSKAAWRYRKNLVLGNSNSDTYYEDKLDNPDEY